VSRDCLCARFTRGEVSVFWRRVNKHRLRAAAAVTFVSTARISTHDYIKDRPILFSI